MSDEVKKEEAEDNFINDIPGETGLNSEGEELAKDGSRKGNRGRPSPYESSPEYYNKVAHALTRAGLNLDVVASELGISLKTLYDWKNKYPDFLQALEAGKEDADDIVKASLYQRATGYDHKAVKIFMPANAEEPVYAPYVEHVPPDVGAIKMWLTNRKPKDWKDKVDIGVSGNLGVATLSDEAIASLPPEAAAALAQAYAKSLERKNAVDDSGPSEDSAG